MATRDTTPLPDHEQPGTHNVRAETPPPDHWQRWATDAVTESPAADAAPGPLAGHSTADSLSGSAANTPEAQAVEADAVNDSSPQLQENAYRVLIVEDDRSQALFAQSILHGAGMDAQVQLQAEEVQQTIAEYRPDLILMDLHMPGLDGMRLTTLIRQQPQHQLLPIVFVELEAVLKA